MFPSQQIQFSLRYFIFIPAKAESRSRKAAAPTPGPLFTRGRRVAVRHGLDLAGAIAVPDAKDDPPAGQDVDHRVILGEPQRVPHRHDVEAAADVDVLRDA